MASIFKNAVKFLGQTLKQAATVEYLKDYRHASKLFVGGNFRLTPKTGFLYHVFFDINTSLSSAIISDRFSLSEIGLMVKSTDLPKFSIDVKKYNAYNRPNLVQSKIGFEPISMVFHDDSSNIVRNFWYDYYKYYYRDSDHGETTYRLKHKYSLDHYGNFGYSRRKDSQDNFLRAIRIYSLHNGRFSEYTLLNPMIKSFRQGAHEAGATGADMTSEMSIDYETVLYADGKIGAESPTGFAKLHYDTSRSPLGAIGGVKSIFGTGGLLDTAGSVVQDISSGNYLSAVFKTARSINTFKGVNLKKAVVSEVRGIYTEAATQAITGAISQSMRSTPPGGYNITVPNQIDGATASKYRGISELANTVALAGTAVLLNSTPVTNKYKTNPTVQSNPIKPTNYKPQFPLIPNAIVRPPAPGTLNLANDRVARNAVNNQYAVNIKKKVGELTENISRLNQQIETNSDQIARLNREVTNNTNSISELEFKYNNIQSLGGTSKEKTDLLNKISAQISEITTLRATNQARILAIKDQISILQERLTQITNERAAITNG